MINKDAQDSPYIERKDAVNAKLRLIGNSILIENDFAILAQSAHDSTDISLYKFDSNGRMAIIKGLSYITGMRKLYQNEYKHFFIAFDEPKRLQIYTLNSNVNLLSKVSRDRSITSLVSYYSVMSESLDLRNYAISSGLFEPSVIAHAIANGVVIMDRTGNAHLINLEIKNKSKYSSLHTLKVIYTIENDTYTIYLKLSNREKGISEMVALASLSGDLKTFTLKSENGHIYNYEYIQLEKGGL